MATTQPIRLLCKPGIKRDGTLFEGDEYKDGLWMRFSRRGYPKKMGGYKAIASTLPEVVRGMNAYFAGGINYIHMGSASFLQQVQSDIFGNPGFQADRSPAGFAANANNLWQIEQFFNTATAQTAIVANAGQNLNDITNSVETPIYYGPAAATSALVASNMPNVSGGAVAIAPYLLGYSNYGRIDVSPINNINSGTVNSAFISDQKVVKGLPLRNGSGGPAAIFWTLGDLVVATYNPALLAGIPFNFNTISSDISVLSSQAIVELDGIYYWPEIDHFSMFNGVVRELPNDKNVEWFFKNLNFAQRQKVFAIKIQSASEIWWCFPFGSATECNWAVIYNTYLNTWYDTPLPETGRTAGESPRVFNKPYFTDLVNTQTGFTVWQHETGLDKTASGQAFPIRAYIKTTEFSPVILGKHDKSYRVDITEPDILRTGDLLCTLFGRSNAASPQAALEVVTWPYTPQPPTVDNQIVRFKHDARLMAFQFETNTLGGDFYMGATYAHLEETDSRITQ